MAKLCGILVDLDLCVGCYACAVACKQENNVPIGTQWIKVMPVGPAEVRGNLYMDFIPIMNAGCTLCVHRLSESLRPICVDNCPANALVFCKNANQVLAAFRSGKRFQISKLKGEVPAFG